MVRRTGTYGVAALAVAAAVALSGCSSSGGGGSSSSTPRPSSGSGGAGSSSSGDAGVAAAQAAIKPYSAQGSSIVINTPLSGKPATGKKVFYVAVADPTATGIQKGLQAATTALGWSLKTLTWTTNPADANNLIKQAVQQGADYIAYDAVASQLVSGGIAAAKAAKIPVFESFDVTPPQGPANWLFSNVGGGQDFALRGRLAADVITANGNGKANVLIANVPSFPVQKVFGDAAKAEFKKVCTKCQVNALDFAYTDLTGGKIPGAVVNYLRSHTSVKYILFGFGGMVTGFPQAAKAAQLKLGDGGIQIVEQNPTQDNRQNVLNGTELASIASPNTYSGWLIADAMARKSLNMDLSVNWKVAGPQLIQTKNNLKDSKDEYLGPKNYEGQFKTLWKLG